MKRRRETHSPFNTNHPTSAQDIPILPHGTHSVSRVGIPNLKAIRYFNILIWVS